MEGRQNVCGKERGVSLQRNRALWWYFMRRESFADAKACTALWSHIPHFDFRSVRCPSWRFGVYVRDDAGTGGESRWCAMQCGEAVGLCRARVPWWHTRCRSPVRVESGGKPGEDWEIWCERLRDSIWTVSNHHAISNCVLCCSSL